MFSGLAHNAAMRLAIYPGSFDPPTLGHLDIIERGAKLFDRLIVAVGANSSKSGFLPVSEREAALRACTTHLPNVEVSSFQGLLVEYAKAHGATSVIRGLRAVSDFDYEFQIAAANRRLSPELDTVLLMTKWDYSYVSSSVVREIAHLGGDFDQFVPPGVAAFVRNRLARD